MSPSSGPSWRMLTSAENDALQAQRSGNLPTSTNPTTYSTHPRQPSSASAPSTSDPSPSRANARPPPFNALPVPLHSLLEVTPSPGPSTGESDAIRERYRQFKENGYTHPESHTRGSFSSSSSTDSSGKLMKDGFTSNKTVIPQIEDHQQQTDMISSDPALDPTASQPLTSEAHKPRPSSQPLSGALFDFNKFLDPHPSSSTSSNSHREGSPQQARTAAPTRTLCLRHSMMANQDASEKLQRSLDALPINERAAITALWSTFSSSSHSKRRIILEGILTMCCFSQLSDLSESLAQIIRIDPFSLLPREVGLRVLGYLDAISLGKAAQVSRLWKSLADDDLLWRRMCGQHIERKCVHCGWALPLLERRRLHKELNQIAPSTQMISLEHRQAFGEDGSARDEHVVITAPRTATKTLKRPSANDDGVLGEFKRQKLIDHSEHTEDITIPNTKPWKQVYCERLVVEKNWRKGRYKTKSLKLHTNGVMCLQMHQNLANVDYPVLITGSYDRTAIVWRLDTFEPIATLKGHTRAIRGLQFDGVKAITGAMDGTLRIWNWRTGTCLRTLQAGAPVICLNYDQDVLASGLSDGSIKIWDFSTSDCFSLRGHTQSVNTVLLWDGKTTPTADRTQALPHATSPTDPKFLISGSDDLEIKIWDVHARTCIRTLTGHLGQVQSLKLIVVDREVKTEEEARLDEIHEDASCSLDSNNSIAADGATSSRDPASSADNRDGRDKPEPLFPLPADKQAILVSGGLDNLVKLWDIEAGKARTLFGSLEGVWSVAIDPLRLVSGSHDRTVKIWNRDNGACEKTLVGHRGAVTCLDLSDDMIVSGSDDGEVLVWSFGPEEKEERQVVKEIKEVREEMAQ